MTDAATRLAQATPASVARKIRGLSDRTIAWLFVGPTILLLLAINIFPLIWTIYLSFTNFAVNKPNAEVKWVGIRNYTRILTDEDTWSNMQATAHFLIWTIVLQVLLGFLLAYLINKKFRGNDLVTTLIVVPMMLSLSGSILPLGTRFPSGAIQKTSTALSPALRICSFGRSKANAGIVSSERARMVGFMSKFDRQSNGMGYSASIANRSLRKAVR
jgi:hypothetical protein